MKKFFNRRTGFLAEDLAVAALKEKGYIILERNFANRFGEIDIIAKDKNVLVFVEVKAKTGADFGLPEEMVGKKKLEKIRHMAVIYTKGKTLPSRLDVIAIVFNNNNQLLRLTHYENVY